MYSIVHLLILAGSIISNSQTFGNLRLKNPGQMAGVAFIGIYLLGVKIGFKMPFHAAEKAAAPADKARLSHQLAV